MQEAGEQIREVFDDLNVVDAGDHNNTDNYNHVQDGLRLLLEQIEQLREKEEGLTKKQLRGLVKEYDTLLGYCRTYLIGKGDKRASGYGQARLELIYLLEEELINERDELARTYQKLKKNDRSEPLDVIIARGNSTLAVAEHPEQISTVGMTSSTRIPVKLVSDYGEGHVTEQEGFFTPEKKVQSLGACAKTIYDKYKNNENLKPILEFARADASEFIEQMGWLFENFRALIPGGSLLSHEELAKALWMKHNSKIEDDLEELDINQMLERKGPDNLEDALRQLRNGIMLKGGISFCDIDMSPFLSSEEDLKQLVLMAGEASRLGMSMHTAVNMGINVGEELSKRNVLTSRVATFLGRGDLVTGAQPMELEVNGEKKNGVFLEKAKGYDLNQLTFHKDGVPREGDNPLTYITQSQIVNSPDLALDLADMQVLDYIIAQQDRHCFNMLYDVEWDGKNKDNIRIKGVMGIDNDTVGGVVDDETLTQYYCPLPEEMLVIRESTWNKIKDATPEQLLVHFLGLEMTKPEQESLLARVEKLKASVRTGQVRVLSDEKLKQKGMFEAIAKAAHGRDKETNNYFVSMLKLPGDVKSQQKAWVAKQKLGLPQADNSFKYSTIREQIKEPPQNKGSISVEAVSADLRSVSRFFERLEKEDRFTHRNSGSFKWLKKSVEQLRDRLQELSEKHLLEPEGNLSEKEAKSLDVLYRQIHYASSVYLLSHQAKFGLGQRREAIARDIYAMKSPRALTVPVAEREYNELAEEYLPAKKKQGRQRANSVHVREAARENQATGTKAKDDMVLKNDQVLGGNNRTMLPLPM